MRVADFDTSDCSRVPGAPRGYGRRSPIYAAPRPLLTTEILRACARMGDPEAQRRLDAILDFVTSRTSA